MPTPARITIDATPLFSRNTEGHMPDTDIDVDLFAGGGGASDGIHQALGRAPAVAVNHNPRAIGVYSRNNPDARAYLTDVREVNPVEATQGRSVRILWASPDCRSYSPAKGAAPINQKLRALPWIVPYWIAAVRPRFVIMENVPAIAQHWGPLVAKRDATGQVKRDTKGRPQLIPSAHPRKKNRTWKRFIATLERLGYQVHYTSLCAADYGAPTTRERLFLVASRDHEAFEWPAPTHAPADDPRVLRGELLPWEPIHRVLDFTRPAESVIHRKKPVVHNTRYRVSVGIYRHVLLSDAPFILPGTGDVQASSILVNNHRNAPSRPDQPAPTITTQHNRLQLVTAHGAMYRAQHPGRDLRQPCPTITAGGVPARPSTGNPIGLAAQHWLGAPLTCAFLSMYYSADKRRTPGAHTHPVTKPAGTITTVDHHGVAAVTCAPLNAHALLTYYGGAQGLDRSRTLQDPMPTQTSGNRHALLSTHLGSVNHADPLAHLSAEERASAQTLHDMVLEHVPDAAAFSYHGRALIRGFGEQQYVLTDATLRLLHPDELKLAQGFRPDYVLHENHLGERNANDVQVKLIGNSVPPHLARAICAAIKPHLDQPARPRPLPTWLAQRRARQQTIHA